MRHLYTPLNVRRNTAPGVSANDCFVFFIDAPVMTEVSVKASYRRLTGHLHTGVTPAAFSKRRAAYRPTGQTNEPSRRNTRALKRAA